MEPELLEELVGAEWAEWMRLTPQQRWAAQDDIWAIYLGLGGSLAPQYNEQDPMHDTYLECGAYDPDDANLERLAVAIYRAGRAG